MKKLLSISISALLLLGISGCGVENPNFGDFDYTAVYFPHQYPIRTLSLGEGYVDNSLDRELKFNIGVGIGGLRENTQAWQVGYEVMPELVANLRQVNGDTIMSLPSEYYSLANGSEFTIPAGDFSGLVEIQLTNSFLADPIAWGEGGLYVIPMVITSTSADSILRGSPATSNPDRRIAEDWDEVPKDFTLFAVKYINEYHGDYLHRGIDIGYDDQNNPVDTAIYSEEFVVEDQVWKLNTTGRNVVHTNGMSTSLTDGADIYSMALTIDGNQVQVDSVEGSIFKLMSGSGSFQTDGDAWGGEARDAMYLQYTYLSPDSIRHEVRDTLVFRNRGLRFELFEYEVLE
ncbi:MAG: DUF5627 domain-containing protein [Bacteroidota bacterium]